MKIGIDAHGVGGYSLGPGNETYFQNLIGALLDIDSENEYHVFVNHPEAMEQTVAGHRNVGWFRCGHTLNGFNVR